MMTKMVAKLYKSIHSSNDVNRKLCVDKRM